MRGFAEKGGIVSLLLSMPLENCFHSGPFLEVASRVCIQFIPFSLFAETVA